MAGYDDVKTAMRSGTPPELICATCPWDRLCISPPAMTAAEVDQQIAKAKAADAEGGPEASPVRTLMTVLAVSGRDSAGQLCPVFLVRLKADRGVADSIRSTMQQYGEVTSQ